MHARLPDDVPRVRTAASIVEIDREAWNACYPGEIEDYDYLLTVEAAGIEGFQWRYITLVHGGQVIAAMPAFLTDYRLDTTLEEVQALAEKAFRLPAGEPSAYAKPELREARSDVQTIVERLDVGQGKLNMGLRVGATYGSDQYASLLVYNGLLGGFPHSKLFVNVREKASLAYYASSRLDGHKGIMTLQSGIEIANYEKAVQIIKEQLEAMKRGDFAEEDLKRTQAMIVGQLREIQDSAFERIAFDFSNVISGANRTGESFIAEIMAVTPQMATEAAQGVALDTIYFLRDRKEEG